MGMPQSILSLFQFDNWSLSVTTAFALIWLVTWACYITLKTAALAPGTRTANPAIVFNNLEGK